MQSKYHKQEALYRVCSDEWQCVKQIVGKHLVIDYNVVLSLDEINRNMQTREGSTWSILWDTYYLYVSLELREIDRKIDIQT